MTFKPSDNEERYFARLELERRVAAEQRRGSGQDTADAGPGGTSRQAGESCGPASGSNG